MLTTWPSRHVLCALSLGTLTIAGGCEGQSLRREVLAHLADEVFVPAHARLQLAADALAEATSRRCASDDHAAAARTAWARTRADWSVTAAFAFGPVITQMQAGPLDFWPVRTDT